MKKHANVFANEITCEFILMMIIKIERRFMLELKDICFERNDRKILNHINLKFFLDEI